MRPIYFAFQLFGGSTCSGDAAKSTTCHVATPGTNPIFHTITVVADILAIIAGVTAVIMIIVSGLTLITSQGNAEAAKSSRDRIIYSIVGLIIIGLAWMITSFIVNHIN